MEQLQNQIHSHISEVARAKGGYLTLNDVRLIFVGCIMFLVLSMLINSGEGWIGHPGFGTKKGGGWGRRILVDQKMRRRHDLDQISQKTLHHI